MTLKYCLAGAAVAAATLAAAPAAVASTQAVSHAGPGPTVQVHGMRAAVGARLPSTHLPHLAPQMSVASSNWSGYAAAADSGVRRTHDPGRAPVGRPGTLCARLCVSRAQPSW